MIAKRELLKVPIFGFATWLCGTIFIDRKDRSEAVNIMKDAAAKLKANKVGLLSLFVLIAVPLTLTKCMVNWIFDRFCFVAQVLYFL